MNNSILNFEKEELDEFIVSDFFSKDVDIFKILETFTSAQINTYFSTYRISDNDMIERISYDIYGTSNYWDLLLTLNDKQALFQMPYDNDVTSELAEGFWNNYSENIYFQPTVNSSILQTLIDNEIEKMRELNEEYRYIFIIKPTQIHAFIKLMREKGYII